MPTVRGVDDEVVVRQPDALAPRVEAGPVGQYSTTFGDTFGRFNGEPAVPDRPAGAKRKVDRGRSATGMIGEVYMIHDEPGLDTRCQRVWLPNNDLIINPADRGHISSATLARG